MLAFHHQPLKGLYLTYQLIATLFVRIPYWVFSSIPRYVFLLTHFLGILPKSYQIMASQNDLDNEANSFAQDNSTVYKDGGSV